MRSATSSLLTPHQMCHSELSEESPILVMIYIFSFSGAQIGCCQTPLFHLDNSYLVHSEPSLKKMCIKISFKRRGIFYAVSHSSPKS